MPALAAIALTIVFACLHRQVQCIAFIVGLVAGTLQAVPMGSADVPGVMTGPLFATPELFSVRPAHSHLAG